MTRIKAILTVHLLLICCALSLLAQSAASADSVVPGMVKFAGTLNDINGKPLTGTVGVTFLLYSEQSGGAPLWMETQSVQADKNGRYSVMLGSTTKHGMPPDTFAAGQARWLGVQPSGQSEQPRVQLGSVPYALKAADAQTLGGLPPSAFLLAPLPTIPAATAAPTPAPPTGTKPVTTAGGLAKALAKFDGTADIANSQIFDTGTNVGIGTTSPKARLDVHGGSTIRGALALPATGTATATAGENSQPLNITASAFNSGTTRPVNETFRWQTEPVGNNTINPLGKLSLLFGSGSNLPSETGLSVSNQGLITFAPGQTFPGTGNGTVTSVGLSAPISDFTVNGSPVTGSGTLDFEWVVQPSSLAIGGAIVKRDSSGAFSANGIRVSGGAVEVTNTGEGLGAVSTDNLPFTPAVSGRSTATGEGSTHGVNGFSSTTHGAGIFGLSDGSFGSGVLGQDDVSGVGVLGQATGASGQGVFGESLGSQVAGNGFGPDGVDGVTHSSAGAGVGAVNTTSGVGLFAQSNGGNAGFFLGNVDITGVLSKGAGSFKIDHPLDPANKYLYHSFVESPDMMNIYNGVAGLDSNGEAVVKMPDWFEVLNRDFRYQLTSIGAPGPNLFIAEEISGNQFKIAGGKPGAKVSWQVTGIRQDAYANAHRIPVEQVKPENERGLYLHPELFGAPAEKSIAAAHHPNVLKGAKEGKSKSKD
jgi:hypothetical protein